MEPAKNTPEQPKKSDTTPEAAAPSPAPTTPTSQPEPQPAAATQSIQQPQQGQQYVVTHRSLEGVGGWLAFWIVLFALGAIGGIYNFFAQISGEAGVSFKIVDVIFMPIMAIINIVAILLIVMRKKIGKWVAVSSFATSGLYSTITLLTNPIDSVANLVASLLVAWFVLGLFALYFLKSERVKQTLTK
ncbi:MAG TPA: hypothetical protein VFZ58_05170 [Candidatus Saccharimonadales bacterium]